MSHALVIGSMRGPFKRFRLWLRSRKLAGTTQLVVSAPDRHVAIAIVLGSCPDALVVRVKLDAHRGRS
jgi:hypothetical protein